METNQNPFPKIELFPRIQKAARLAGRILTRIPGGAPDYMSSHYRGAAAMLDSHMDNQPELPFEDGGRWDDQGCY